MIDWMDALQDFPLDEVRTACRTFIAGNPSKPPHEGHILSLIEAARVRFLQEQARLNPPAPEPPRPKPVSPDVALEILNSVGFTPKRFGDVAAAPMANTFAEAITKEQSK
ncbi:MAG: hypothetical protein HC889_16935 [Synechococcaceae cyanobacterium SM1_2_3]|nr:hypothetical protein [Synechococcaceae cyanobacterium SM1_2_3]